jgi:hypothetical protein
MPISSTEINQIISQQNAGFANSFNYTGRNNQNQAEQSPLDRFASAQFAGNLGAEKNYGSLIPAIDFGLSKADTAVTGALTLQMLGVGPIMADPFELPMRAAMAGWSAGPRLGMSQLGGAALGGGLFAAPMLGAYVAGSYGLDHMRRGAEQQVLLGNTINRNFAGSGINMSSGIGTFNSLAGVANNITSMTPPSLTGYMNTESMSNLVAQGMQSGAFKGVSNSGQFREKLNSLTQEALQVSQVLKTSIDESYATIQQISSTTGLTGSQVGGFLRSSGSTFNATGMGVGQQLNIASQGAELYRSLGQTGSYGALSALRTGRNIGAFANSGAISNSSLMELGGSDGLFNSFMGVSSRVLQSGLGSQALAAAMREDGSLDMGLARQIASGGISSDEVKKRASKVFQNKSLSKQFQLNQQDMIATFMSEIGPEGILGVAQLGGSSDFDLLSNTGMSKNELSALRSYSGSTGNIRNKMSDAMRSGFNKGSGGAGIKEILSRVSDSIMRPVQNYFEELGREISDSATSYVDDVQRSLTGKVSNRYGGSGVADRVHSMRSVGAFDEARISFGSKKSGLDDLSYSRPESDTAIGQFIRGATPYGVQHLRDGGSVGSLDPMSFIGGASSTGSTLRGLAAYETSTAGGIGILGALSGGNLINAEKLLHGMKTSVKGMVSPILPQSMRVAQSELAYLGTRNLGRFVGLTGGTALRGASMGLRGFGKLAGGPLGMALLELGLRTDDMLAATGVGKRTDGIGGGLSEFMGRQYEAGRDYESDIIGSSNPSLADANGFVPINGQEMNVDGGLESLESNKWTGWLTGRAYRGMSNYFSGSVAQQMYARKQGSALNMVRSVANLSDSSVLQRNMGLSGGAFRSQARSFQQEVNDEMWDYAGVGSDDSFMQQKRFAQRRVASKMYKTPLSDRDLDVIGYAGGDVSLVKARDEAEGLLGRSFYTRGMSEAAYTQKMKETVDSGLSNIISGIEKRETTRIDARNKNVSVVRDEREDRFNDPMDRRNARRHARVGSPGIGMADGYLIGAEKNQLETQLGGMRGVEGQLSTLLTEYINGADPKERVLLAQQDRAALGRLTQNLRGKFDDTTISSLARFVKDESFGGIVSNVAKSGLQREEYERYTKANMENATAYGKAAVRGGTFRDNLGLFSGGSSVAGAFEEMIAQRQQGEDGLESRAEAFRKMGDMDADDLYKLSAHYSDAYHRTGDNTLGDVGMLAATMGEFKKKTEKYMGKKGKNEKGRKANFSALVGDDSELAGILDKSGAFKSGSIDEGTHWKLQGALTQRLRLQYGDNAPQMADRVLRGIGSVFDSDGLTAAEVQSKTVGGDIRTAIQVKGDLASGRGAMQDKGSMTSQKFNDVIDNVTTKLGGVSTALDTFAGKLNNTTAGPPAKTPDNGGSDNGILAMFGLNG